MDANNFFEQAAQITKAHAYDVISKQVGELKEENRAMADVLKQIREAYWDLLPEEVCLIIDATLKNRKPYNL